MSRPKWKPLYLNDQITLHSKNVKNNTEIFVYNRSGVIIKPMIGLRINIYNGIKFIPVTISADMLGQRLGEFAPTRKKPIVKKKMIKKK